MAAVLFVIIHAGDVGVTERELCHHVVIGHIVIIETKIRALAFDGDEASGEAVLPDILCQAEVFELIGRVEADRALPVVGGDDREHRQLIFKEIPLVWLDVDMQLGYDAIARLYGTVGAYDVGVDGDGELSCRQVLVEIVAVL